MAKSNLLKDAIADAKTVRETAIANAKIALEEAFTPRLQSILSQKLQKEIDGEDEDEEDQIEEEYGAEDAPTGDSSSIGAGKGGTESGTSGKQPSGITNRAHTELGDTDKESSAVGSELDDVEVVREGEGEDENGDGVIDDPTGATVTEDDDFDVDDVDGDSDETDDELDLEAIIRELEDDFEGEDDGEEFGDDEVSVEPEIEEDGDEEIGDEPIETEPEADDFGGEESDDEDIDLDEILREMGYGDDEEEVNENDEDDSEALKAKEAELEEAYKVIRSLKGTINEVNLLNAKLLYSNKLFRSYELTNEQKMKVIETLDRTRNVREVKLVFATLAESMKVGNTNKKASTKKLTESFASNVVKSTAPKKEIIAESNGMADRFKQLANIKPLKG